MQSYVSHTEYEYSRISVYDAVQIGTYTNNSAYVASSSERIKAKNYKQIVMK